MDNALAIFNAYQAIAPSIAPFNLGAYIVPLLKVAVALYVK
jgi:hypothetical protein